MKFFFWKITKIINKKKIKLKITKPRNFKKINYFTYLEGKDSYYFLQLVAQTKKTCQKIL